MALSLKDAERERRGRPADPRAACMRSVLPDRDGRSADEIAGYDDDGLW